MDRLLREGNPPAGQLASPKPQYKKPGVDEYAPVEGQHGAPFATLKDASGNVVSPATDAKLEQVKSELELVKSELQTIKANQLSGDQKVQLSGTIVGVEVTRPGSIVLEPGQKIYEPVVDFRDEMFALSYSLRHVAEGSAYAEPVLKWSCAIQNSFHEYDTVQELEHEELIGLESKVTKTTKKIFPVGRYGRLMIENKDNTKNVVIYRVTCTKYRA